MSKSKSKIVYTVVVDTGIELPPKPTPIGRRKGTSKYAFLNNLQPNQSFLVPDKRSMYGTVAASRKMGIKLAVRAWKTDEQPNQYRIWFIGHKAAA